MPAAGRCRAPAGQVAEMEDKQKPTQTRDLYLLAGRVSGLLAKASQDLVRPHDAMTQARTMFVCADNADHHGLRAWARGLKPGSVDGS